ncbi:hypothetical protein GGX14DRAFT_393664 [Mycena pura]|uniref:Uncharacterized protein n=1 Tax=Mycena pura TaxID=153505 RepID=A0AAD6VG10_9AGAR|nr:hypothetical protein GGX14DRAFT_393664 [Mycena pura]
MNVVGALIQVVAERDGNSDFAIFSSFLSPLISRELVQGSHYGTIEGHILAACQGQPKEVLLAKELILLNTGTCRVGGDCLRIPRTVGGESRAVEGVLRISRPIDAANEWMGMRIFHNPCHASCCERGIYHTERIQTETLEMIFGNLSFLEKPTEPVVAEHPTIETNPVERLGQLTGSTLKLTGRPMPAAVRWTWIASPRATVPLIIFLTCFRRLFMQFPKFVPPAASSSKRKSSPDGTIESAPSKKAKRAPKRSEAERKAALEGNKWISAVLPERVKCRACTNWIELGKKRSYKSDNWERHEGKCTNITGVRTIRKVSHKPIVKPVTGAAAISSFFGKVSTASKLSEPSQPVPKIATTSSKPTKEIRNSDSESDNDVGKKRKPTYTAHLVTAGIYRSNPLGGISPTLRARISQQILFYKALGGKVRTPDSDARIARSIPANGNDCISSSDWTVAEHKKFDEALQGYARWEVNLANKVVRSTRCEGLTTNPNGIYNPCTKLSKDESLKCSIRRKKKEASLSLAEQHDILLSREKFSWKRFADTEARKLQRLLKDPLVFNTFKDLDKDEPTACFIKLYEAAQNGKLKKHETVTDLCKVVAEMLDRDCSAKKYGMRYPARYLNFMILMRSYGGNSSKQYGILSGEIPCPLSRHLRTLVARSEDALQNPMLIFENIARLADSIKYTGPVAVAGDCTKVRKRLTYSTDFGGHILGGVLPLQECVALDRDDIEQVIERIQKAKAEATQVRAILVKIPLPQIPPQVVALIPTDGKDDANKIVEEHLKLLQMAKYHDLSAPVMETGPVVSITDGFHARKTGRNQPQHGTKTQSMGSEVLVNNNLVQIYETGESGVLHSDVNNTAKQDDGPARRIFHHQALVACCTGEDKETRIRDGFGGTFVTEFSQSSEPASSFTSGATTSTTCKKIPDLYSPTRSFISPASFHIFNRLCDSLLLLVIIYTRYYPDQPFCPWLLLTDFVEHFFGLARMMLPNFTYTEFLKIVQHVMVRQRILLSGSFKERRERKAGLGYVLDFDATPLTAEDLKLAYVSIADTEMNSLVELAFHEASLICTQLLHISAPMPTVDKHLNLTPLGAPPPKAKIADSDDSDADSDADSDSDAEVEVSESPSRRVEMAAHDAARYSALCDDYEAAVVEAAALTALGPPHRQSLLLSFLRPPPLPLSIYTSEFIVMSISAMLQARLHWQSGTTKSEKVVRIDSKYALSRIARGIGLQHDDDTDSELEKMTLQEASNTVRVLQDLNSVTHENKLRKVRWKSGAATIQKLVNSSGKYFYYARVGQSNMS